MNSREYIEALAPTRDQIERFTRQGHGPGNLSANSGWTFDAETGWVLVDAERRDGAGKTKTFYHYEADGARRCVNAADKSCRIHTYGDSFTHCDQVNDGETWQEFLAAHLREPIRNYGVGGYSVYQAYRRMRKVEAEHPAPYIILNIYDDDHFRNLDAWRSLRFGVRGPCAFPLPHVRVDVERGLCEEVDNPARTAEDLYRMCDKEVFYETYKNDPVLQMVLAAGKKEGVRPEELEPFAVSFGLPSDRLSGGEAADRLRTIHTAAALYATRRVVGLTETFAEETGKKLMVILSYGRASLRKALSGETRFDLSFVEWLKTRPYPVVDMLDILLRDYAFFSGGAEAFIAKYYVGHLNPLGNFFSAWTIRETVARWLDPAPEPYQS